MFPCVSVACWTCGVSRCTSGSRVCQLSCSVTGMILPPKCPYSPVIHSSQVSILRLKPVWRAANPAIGLLPIVSYRCPSEDVINSSAIHSCGSSLSAWTIRALAASRFSSVKWRLAASRSSRSL